MTIFNEPQHNAEAFVSEANNSRSRDSLKLAASTTAYISGTVLKDSGAVDNGDIVYERFDGTGTAVAILYHGAEISTDVQKGVGYFRDMEYKLQKLVFLDAATQAHKDAAVASLKAQGMIARDAN